MNIIIAQRKRKIPNLNYSCDKQKVDKSRSIEKGKKEKLRRAKQAQDRASNVWTEDTPNNAKLNVLIYVE